MDRKRSLKFVTSIIICCGIVFAAFPFFASMRISEKSKNDSLVLIDLPELIEGQVKVVEVNGSELFFLKPNQQQRDSILQLNAHVWDKTINTFNAEFGAYVYWGHSTKWGCLLKSMPAQESQMYIYDKTTKWLGGYWDAACEVSYDYAGRAIHTYNYSFNGYTAQHSNLKTPTIFQKSGSKYVVSILQR